MPTAIVDAAAARRDYLDETGGRYVHLIAYGDVRTGGDIARRSPAAPMRSCSAEPLAARRRTLRARAVLGLHRGPSTGAPLECRALRRARGSTSRRSKRSWSDRPRIRPASGTLFGALRRAMAKCGYSSVKEFQRLS